MLRFNHNKINFNENNFFKYNNFIMENDIKENKGKEAAQNGAYVRDNNDNRNNIDVNNEDKRDNNIDEKYDELELIKQKARNDVDLLLKEKGILENNDKNVVIKGNKIYKKDNGKFNIQKIGNSKNKKNNNKNVVINNKNNINKKNKINKNNNEYDNIEYLVEKYDLDDNDQFNLDIDYDENNYKQLNDFLSINKVDPIEAASPQMKLINK